MGWDLLDHTGDVGLEVDAADLDGLFAEALRGFTDCLTDVAGVRPDLRRRLELRAAAVDLLLVDWLQEALYLFDTEGLVFSAATVRVTPVDRDGRARLRARLSGERFDPARHRLKAPLKAVTYHALALRHADDRWRARVVFDL